MNGKIKKVALIMMGGIALASLSASYAAERSTVNEQIEALSSMSDSIRPTQTDGVYQSRRDSANTSNTGSHYLFWGDVSDPDDCSLPTGHPYTDQGDGTFCAADGPDTAFGSRAADIRCFEQSLAGGNPIEQDNVSCITSIGAIPSGMSSVSCQINILECPPPVPSPMVLVYDASSITLPLFGSVDVMVDWGVDGGHCQSVINSPGYYTCNYGSGGEKIVQISGILEHYGIFHGSDWIPDAALRSQRDAARNSNRNLIRVNSFGSNMGLTSLDYAFLDGNRLVSVPANIPDEVNSLMYTFAAAHIFNDPNINSWDVSNVTTLQGTFNNAVLFNQPLNNWNVSNVTSLEDTFRGANVFNQPLNNWDVSNVTTLRNTFGSAWAFNQPLDNWNVSSVEDMSSTFYSASAFDQPLNNWDVSNVTTLSNTFHGAWVFNQPLDNWNVSSVEDMSSTFRRTRAFDQPLNNWNVSNVTTLILTFNEALAFNQPLNNWNTANVTSMQGAFAGANFTNDISSWNTSRVTNMSYMFSGVVASGTQNPFNGDLSSWDVSSVVTFQQMFRFNNAFNSDISGWNTVSATDMRAMFFESAFNRRICDWNVASVTATMRSNFMTISPLSSNEPDAPKFSGTSWGSNCP